MIERQRLYYLLFAVIVMGVGLISRTDSIPTPYLFQTYGGDILWASLVYLGLALLFPKTKPLYIALGALLFAYCIEFSQLYSAPWFNTIRSTKIGRLIFGFGFLPSDFVCYTVGVVIPYGLEMLNLSKQNR